MSKNTPAKAGEAEPKTSAAGDAEQTTTGATTETPSSTDLKSTPTDPVTTKLVSARVLTDCAFGKANSIAMVPADVAEASTELDANEAAVAYAQLLAEKITAQP